MDMIELPGGTFQMGSTRFYADEGPVHERAVEPFAIAKHPVTNRDFAEFVASTGYITVAEEPLDPRQFAHLGDKGRAPGAMVFTPTAGPVDLGDWRQWWRWQPGAKWSAPFGPESGIEDRLDHPVVQVSFRDAQAFAAWAKGRLPSEAEWEFAARGGLHDTDFAWGAEARPAGEVMANHWQGRFPYLNTGAKGWSGTSPVALFPPNGFGLYDMTGNVWEWTSDQYTPFHVIPGWQTPEIGERVDLFAPSPGSPQQPYEIRRVLKGGSHLCAPEYCLRFRPSARSPQSDDTAMTHIGFRLARSL